MKRGQPGGLPSLFFARWGTRRKERAGEIAAMAFRPQHSTAGTSALSASSDLQSASNVRGYFAKSSPGANCSGFTKMEATTMSHSDRACRTKERCPSCRAPIVGTKPSTKRLVRKSRQTLCISATVYTIRTAVPSLLVRNSQTSFLELQSSNTASL